MDNSHQNSWTRFAVLVSSSCKRLSYTSVEIQLVGGGRSGFYLVLRQTIGGALDWLHRLYAPLGVYGLWHDPEIVQKNVTKYQAADVRQMLSHQIGCRS